MRSALLRASLLLCVVTASGCHLIFPFSDGGDGPAPASDRRQADLARQDASWKPLDASAPDRLVRDAADPCNLTGACHECEPLKNPLCDQACVSADCDDLPDGRDPWQGPCNKVIFEDGFCDVTLGNWEKVFAAGSMNVKTRGLLQIEPPTHTTAMIRVKDAVAQQKLQQSYLLEVAFTPPPLLSTWTVTVRMLMAEPQGLMCQLDHTNGLALNGWFDSSSGKSSWGQDTAAAPSGQVVMQAWHDVGKGLVCRLLQGNAPLAEAKVPWTGSVTERGGIELEVITPMNMPPAVTRFDFVRAFSVL